MIDPDGNEAEINSRYLYGVPSVNSVLPLICCDCP